MNAWGLNAHRADGRAGTQYVLRRISYTVVLSRLSRPFSRRFLMYINGRCVGFRNPKTVADNSCCRQCRPSAYCTGAI